MHHKNEEASWEQGAYLGVRFCSGTRQKERSRKGEPKEGSGFEVRRTQKILKRRVCALVRVVQRLTDALAQGVVMRQHESEQAKAQIQRKNITNQQQDQYP